jgi:hypothetical protein
MAPDLADDKPATYVDVEAQQIDNLRTEIGELFDILENEPFCAIPQKGKEEPCWILSAANAVVNSQSNHENAVTALDVASGSKSLRGRKMPDIKCPGENVLKHGLVWLCCDGRKDECSEVNIITDGGKVEIHVCQDPHPKENAAEINFHDRRLISEIFRGLDE